MLPVLAKIAETRECSKGKQGKWFGDPKMLAKCFCICLASEHAVADRERIVRREADRFG
jgi:hypothetical protein